MSDNRPPVTRSPQADLPKTGRIRRIVIVGRDEALWLAANTMWTSFHKTGLEIIVVELPSLLHPVDVIPTLRSQQGFHYLMRLQEAPLMATTGATYSLGQRFVDFSKGQPSFMHAYGSYGFPINSVQFHHFWVKARGLGLKVDYDDFSLNAIAALQGRFFLPNMETDKFAQCEYAYHLEAQAYCEGLKQVAQAYGINRIEAARLGEISQDPENGHITAIGLPDGQRVEGDFFIDTTGAESLLLGAVLGTQIESWKQWFPFDRLLATSGRSLPHLPALSQVTAFRSGWVGQFPLRNRMAIQQAFNSFDLNKQEALDTAARVASTRLDAEPVIRPYAAGRRRTPWSGNCVAIGEAAAIFDPIDSARAQSILTGLSHLTSLLPIDRNMALESKEYNLNVISSFERLRDYQICHYKLNKRFGEPLWDQCRDMSVPDSLAYKLEQFEARGHLVEYDDETFLDYDWRAMLIGHGLIPRDYDPVADQTSEDELASRFQQMLDFIKGQVNAMRPMQAFFTERPAGASL